MIFEIFGTSRNKYNFIFDAKELKIINYSIYLFFHIGAVTPVRSSDLVHGIDFYTIWSSKRCRNGCRPLRSPYLNNISRYFA